jgi:Flp pilus assembly pilin Flp
MRRSILHQLAAVLGDERGTALAEYALISATLGVAMVSGVAVLQANSGRELSATASGWISVALTPP